MKILKAGLCLVVAACLVFNASAQKKKVKAVPVQVEVGGAVMSPEKDIVENTTSSADHTQFMEAFQAAGIVENLKAPGPFTVFAPTNHAFFLAGKYNIDELLKPENADKLKGILNYHVVDGKYTTQSILSLIAKNNGKAELTTIQGTTLIAEKKGENIMLTAGNGTKAFISIANVPESNGIVHVIDRVLMPGQEITKN